MGPFMAMMMRRAHAADLAKLTAALEGGGGG
jgi:hypothetical protein